MVAKPSIQQLKDDINLALPDNVSEDISEGDVRDEGFQNTIDTLTSPYEQIHVSGDWVSIGGGFYRITVPAGGGSGHGRGLKVWAKHFITVGGKLIDSGATILIDPATGDVDIEYSDNTVGGTIWIGTAG